MSSCATLLRQLIRVQTKLAEISASFSVLPVFPFTPGTHGNVLPAAVHLRRFLLILLHCHLHTLSDFDELFTGQVCGDPENEAVFLISPNNDVGLPLPALNI